MRSAPREGGKGERRRERREGNSGPETKGGEQSREHPGHSPLPQSGTHAGAAAEHGEAWPGEGPGAAGRRPRALRRRGPGRCLAARRCAGPAVPGGAAGPDGASLPASGGLRALPLRCGPPARGGLGRFGPRSAAKPRAPTGPRPELPTARSDSPVGGRRVAARGPRPLPRPLRRTRETNGRGGAGAAPLQAELLGRAAPPFLLSLSELRRPCGPVPPVPLVSLPRAGADFARLLGGGALRLYLNP